MGYAYFSLLPFSSVLAISRRNIISVNLHVLYYLFQDFKVSITEEFIEHCSDGALSIEVWGHRSQGFGLINPELDNVNLRSRTLSDR